MSLYKTQRCRHFDEFGNPVKPYCSQGNKCRFIHPNDHQWAKLRRRDEGTLSPESHDAVRWKGQNRLPLSPGNPLPRRRSSPLISQTDLLKRKQKDPPREYDHRDWSIRTGDRRRDSDPCDHARERDGHMEHGRSLKRANDESDSYPNQRPRLSERILYGPAPGCGTSDGRRVPQTAKITLPLPISECDPKTTKVSDTFHRLAKLCCTMVQDSCLLDRDEDKLKAFTGLSSELSRAIPDAAMGVTPALATVITGHTRTRERLESHVEELETLWKTLFTMLESDISKVIESRLEQAMSFLHKERDDALRMITHSQRLIDDGLYDGATVPRQRTGDWRDMTTDRIPTLLERNAVCVNDRPTMNTSPEEMYRHGTSTSPSLVQTQEGDLGTSLRIVLEDMKMQMDRQTRAIELLAKENLQLKSATERIPAQLVPPDPKSSSSRKSSIL